MASRFLGAQPHGIRSIVSSPPPSWEPWRPRPSKKNPMESSSSQAGVIAGLVIGFMATLLLFTLVWSTCKGSREARDRGGGAGARTAASDHDDQHLRRASASSQTAIVPALTYSPSVKHDAKDDGEEATTCSVCLAAFQLGEAVRLLPAGLHLYHVECIDPWLDAHSTCPLCRSDTYLTMDVV